MDPINRIVILFLDYMRPFILKCPQLYSRHTYEYSIVLLIQIIFFGVAVSIFYRIFKGKLQKFKKTMADLWTNHSLVFVLLFFMLFFLFCYLGVKEAQWEYACKAPHQF